MSQPFDMIDYEDFSRIELWSGTVTKAELFSRARHSAYKVWVDFGKSIGIKQTSAQITTHYQPEALVGQQVIGCVNLPPKNIAGFISEFLLVGFADDTGAIRLARIDGTVQNGQKLC